MGFTMLKYKFTDLGKIIDRPTSMGSNRGMYQPTVIETANISDFNAPYSHIIYASTDHVAGDGGIWAWLFDGTNWVDYDDALASGNLSAMPDLPAGNPIYINTEAAGTQTETPHAKVINGTVYMMTHNNGGQNYPGVGSNQNTAMSTSSNGFNFTHRNIVLTYNPDTQMGNGHTGYAKWDDNPFPEYDFDYIAYSIAGGEGTGGFAMWGSNEADILQPWTLIKTTKRSCGRVFNDNPDYAAGVAQLSYRIDPSSLIPQADGTFVTVAGSNPQGSSGAELAVGSSNQIVLSSDGFSSLSKVERALEHTAENINGIELSGKLSYGGKNYMIYRGIGAGDSSTAVGFVGMAEYEIVDGSIPLLDPADSEHDDVSFIGASALPSNIELMTGEGSLAFTANGLEITIPAGKTEGLYLPDVKTNMKLLDISWVNMRQKVAQEWYPRVGFVKDYVYGSALDYETYISTGYEPTSDDNWHNQMTLIQMVEGLEDSLTSYPQNVIGRWNSNYENSIVPTSYGVRWIPTEDRVTLLNTRHEQDFTSASSMPDGEYTPFIQIENTEATDSITVIIEGISFGQAGDIDFAWTLDSKPTASTVAVSDATAKNFDVELDEEGTYVFGLVASDEDDSSPKVTRAITLGTANTAPTANAGANQTLAANIQGQLSGSGTATTAGATITGYQWIAPAGITLNGANTANPTFTTPQLNAATTFTFSLVVTDSNGLTSAADTVDVVVEAYSPPVETDSSVLVLNVPTANGQYDVYLHTKEDGKEVVFDGVVTFNNGGATIQLDIDDGILLTGDATPVSNPTEFNSFGIWGVTQ